MSRPAPPSLIEAKMTRYAAAHALLLAVLAIASSSLAAEGDPLHIELNRLEQHGDGCRVHLVLENPAPRAYTSYRLDLVIFDAEGVIARRLALETAPLRANKTMVKEFELTGLPCKGVGRLLLNDVSACASPAGDLDDCVAATRVSSRNAVSFVK